MLIVLVVRYINKCSPHFYSFLFVLYIHLRLAYILFKKEKKKIRKICSTCEPQQQYSVSTRPTLLVYGTSYTHTYTHTKHTIVLIFPSELSHFRLCRQHRIVRTVHNVTC